MFVFVCWTPYQIFNAVNFVLSDVEGSRGNADIYVYHDFGNSRALSEALKKSGVFNNVYDIKCYDKRRKLWYSKFLKFQRLLMPYSTIRRFLEADIDVRNKGYKTLLISGNNLFSINMYNSIKGLQVYFTDDGTGTYFGDTRERDITLIYKIFNKLFNRGPMSYDVKKLYINNKDICKATICEEKVQMPRLAAGSEVEQKLKEIFSYKENSAYKDNKFIYLTQPLEETAIGKKAIDIEKGLLAKIKDDVLVRVHPRQNIEDYSAYSVDTAKNLWELECLGQIREDHVLIGGYSTAQFAPKLLFDCEPTVVFTYKLYGTEIYNASETIELLRNSYRDPSKIIVPETAEELEAIIK